MKAAAITDDYPLSGQIPPPGGGGGGAPRLHDYVKEHPLGVGTSLATLLESVRVCGNYHPPAASGETGLER